MERHFKLDEQPLTFEMLEELSRKSPRQVVKMQAGELTFRQQGEFSLSKWRISTMSIAKSTCENLLKRQHHNRHHLCSFSDAYKEQYVTWEENKVTSKVLRPNVECTNGIIHLADHVFIDDAPPWTVGGQQRSAGAPHLTLLLLSLAAVALLTTKTASS